jgi:hypothetical protein
MLVFGMTIKMLSNVCILVENRPISSTTPNTPLIFTASPTLNGRNSISITPAEKLLRRALQGQTNGKTGDTKQGNKAGGFHPETVQHGDDGSDQDEHL